LGRDGGKKGAEVKEGKMGREGEKDGLKGKWRFTRVSGKERYDTA